MPQTLSLDQLEAPPSGGKSVGGGKVLSLDELESPIDSGPTPKDIPRGVFSRPFGEPSGEDPKTQGFWSSVGNAMRSPFDLAASLDTIQPMDIVHGLLSPAEKLGSGNWKGAAGDLVGAAGIGRILKGPSDTPLPPRPEPASQWSPSGPPPGGATFTGTNPGIVVRGVPKPTAQPPIVTVGDAIRFPFAPKSTVLRVAKRGLDRFISPVEGLPEKPASSASPTWKPSPEAPKPQQKPSGVGPTWNRNATISPKPAEPPSPLVGVDESTIQRIVQEHAKPKADTESAPRVKLAPDPQTVAEIHRSTHAIAKDLWGSKDVHTNLSRLIEERYGKNRTTAYKNPAEGKTPLTMQERADLHNHLLKRMPDKPAVKLPEAPE